MSQPNAISEKLAWASALVSCAFPQGHQRREYTSFEVVEYLSSIRTTDNYDFSTSNEAMEAVFADKWFRKYIQDFSGNLVSFERRNPQYKILFDQSLLNGSLTKGEMMKNAKARYDLFFQAPEPTTIITLRNKRRVVKAPARASARLQGADIENDNDNSNNSDNDEDIAQGSEDGGADNDVSPSAGRPVDSIAILRSKLRKAKRKNRELQKKIDQLQLDNEKEIDNSPEGRSAEFLSFVRRGGSYKTTDPDDPEDKKTYVTAGASSLFADINVVGNVSKEKIPLVLTDALTIYCGPMTLEAIKELVPSTTLLSTTIDAAGKMVSEKTLETFRDQVVEGCLLTDDSNKNDANLKLKLVALKLKNESIILTGLGTDTTFSKKCDKNSDQAYDAIIDEIGRELIDLFTTFCIDWFAHGKEVKKLAAAIDKIAILNVSRGPIISKLPATPDHPIILVFYRNVPFRIYRARPCKPHNLERILNKYLLTFGQKAGINEDGSSSQAIYRCHYYIDKKLWASFCYLVELFYNKAGIPIPELLINQLGAMAANRWLSFETRADRLVQLLSIEAPQSLIDGLKEIYEDVNGEVDALKWTKILYDSQCIHDPSKQSSYILLIMLLANLSSGGVDGEIRTNLTKIVGFLAASEHRMAIILLAAWLPTHRNWLAFPASPASPDIFPNSELYGNRAPESINDSRLILKVVSDFAFDWKSSLPEVYASMVKLSTRPKSFASDSDITPEEFVASWSKNISDQGPPMLEAGLKYLRDIDLTIGWSILLVLEPSLGPIFAQGLLDALVICQFKDSAGNLIPIPLHGTQAPQEPAADSAEASSRWTLDSKYFAYPGMSFAALLITIRNSFVKDKAGTAAICAAYGLLHSGVLQNLVSIAKGDLIKSLQLTAWKPGDHLHSFFKSNFAPNFIYLTEVIQNNFSVVMVTNSPTEGVFSNVLNVTHKNESTKSKSNKIQHLVAVKGRYLRRMKYREDGRGIFRRKNSKSAPKRQLRSSASRLDYATNVYKSASNKIFKFNKAVMGKRKVDRVLSNKYAKAELDANRAKRHLAISFDSTREGFEKSKRTGSTTLPGLEGDEKLLKDIKSMKTPKAVELLTKYMIIEVPKTRKRKSDNTNVDDNINDLLFKLFKRCPEASVDVSQDVFEQHKLLLIGLKEFSEVIEE
jgi:hypothetical protein